MQKSTQTRVVGKMTGKVHPTPYYFSSNIVSMKNCRDAVIFPTIDPCLCTPVCV